MLTMIVGRMAAHEVIESRDQEQIKSNNTLKRFFLKHGEILDAHRVYAEPLGVQISDEKYGDMVEALLDKTCNLALLEAVIAHGLGF